MFFVSHARSSTESTSLWLIFKELNDLQKRRSFLIKNWPPPWLRKTLSRADCFSSSIDRYLGGQAKRGTLLPQAMKLRKVAELLFWLQVRNRSQTRWAHFLVETIWIPNWSRIWWMKLDLHGRKFIDCISDISIWIRTRRGTWMKMIFIEFIG